MELHCATMLRDPMVSTDMLAGQIQSLVAAKGFGFIKPTAGGADVFFHRSVLDAPFESLTEGQSVKYELDAQADKPRASRVQTGADSSSTKATRRSHQRDTSQSGRQTARRTARRIEYEHGFVTKLHRKRFRGFISSIKHGPEFLFSADSVTGDKRFSRLEIGDYVQFLVGEPDPSDPEQRVAKDVQVVERQVKIPGAKQLGRHPNARKKKPTWR